MNILSAVTTCPRPGGVSYLESTLESLHAAGFDPLVVSDADGAGSWPTMQKALRTLMEMGADAYAVFQDDIKAARGLRGWLDDQFSHWSPQLTAESWIKAGVFSLYTASVNHVRPGWFTLDDLGAYRPYGACALLFPRHAAELLLSKPVNHGFRFGTDTSVATFTRKYGLEYWMFSPSLIEHVGAQSAIFGDVLPLIPERVAGQFCEDCATLSVTSSSVRDPASSSQAST